MLNNYENGKIYIIAFGAKMLVGRLRKNETSAEYLLESVAEVVTINIPVEGRNERGQVIQEIQVRYYMVPLGELILGYTSILCQITKDSPIYSSYYQNILKLDIQLAVPSDIPSTSLQRM